MIGSLRVWDRRLRPCPAVYKAPPPPAAKAGTAGFLPGRRSEMILPQVHSKEAAMPLFIMSINWTEQGIRTIKDWPKRMGDTHAFAKKVGVEVQEVYLTAGEYDLIAVVDAAGDDNIAKFALGLGVNGNVRTKTARAWSESELRKMVSELP
jgi:uncharacterized protein with GYD domain